MLALLHARVIRKRRNMRLRYFHMALAILPEISDDPTFSNIQEYWAADDVKKSSIIESLQSTNNLTTRRYLLRSAAGKHPYPMGFATDSILISSPERR